MTQPYDTGQSGVYTFPPASLLAQNNLSDVANKATALSNLGLALGGTNFTGMGFGVTGSAVTANQLYLQTVQIPISITLTGITMLNGGTVAGNVLAAVYNSTGTTQLAASVSTVQAGTFQAQRIPFTGPIAVSDGPYIFAVVFSLSTATTGAAAFASPTSQTALGSFALPATVTPPTFQAFTIPMLISY